MKLVHLVPALKAGGAIQALRGLMNRLDDMQHTVLALDGAVRGDVLVSLLRTGARVLRAPDHVQVRDAVDAADVVLVHYYNHPLLLRLLAAGLTQARWVVWYQVLGRGLPQVFYPDRLDEGVWCVFTAAPQKTWGRPGPVIPGMVDSAFFDLARVPHAGLVIDYIGSANVAKLHPGSIRFLSPLQGEGLRIRFHGGPLGDAMREDLARAANARCFEIGGFAQDVPGLLATSDIFITPMAPESYASSDLSLQEAMHAGLPSVVLGENGPADMITHGHDGLVVQTGAAFTAALQRLCDDAALRHRLGQAARATAVSRFDPVRNAARMRDVLAARAKTPRSDFGFASKPDLKPAVVYLMSQGWVEAGAVAAVSGWSAGRRSDLERFAIGLSKVGAQVEGGLIHWRNTFPDDVVLRWMTGVWMHAAGDNETAKAEFAAAGEPDATAGGGQHR